jgi:hypothetical protein
VPRSVLTTVFRVPTSGNTRGYAWDGRIPRSFQLTDLTSAFQLSWDYPFLSYSLCKKKKRERERKCKKINLIRANPYRVPLAISKNSLCPSSQKLCGIERKNVLSKQKHREGPKTSGKCKRFQRIHRPWIFVQISLLPLYLWAV